MPYFCQDFRAHTYHPERDRTSATAVEDIDSRERSCHVTWEVLMKQRHLAQRKDEGNEWRLIADLRAAGHTEQILQRMHS